MSKDNEQINLKDKLYLHVGNSGVTFSITDRHGPTIEISSGAFGNIRNTFVVHTNKSDLRRLGEMFLRCSELSYPDPYCHMARSQKATE